MYDLNRQNPETKTQGKVFMPLNFLSMTPKAEAAKKQTN